MQQAKKKEDILESYLLRIDTILRGMTFHLFDNGKPYSVDYQAKKECDALLAELEIQRQQSGLSRISPKVTNKLPIFLPVSTQRIAFFEYQAKSVREIDLMQLPPILQRQGEKRALEGIMDKFTTICG